MSVTDYIPQKDGDLVPWTENFIAVANANLPALGLIAGDITALTTKKSDYSTGLNAAVAKQAESKAATDNKNVKKSALTDNIRVLARQIQARPGVPDNLKVQLGLNAPDPVPSPTGPFPPVSTTIESLSLHQYRISWGRNGNSYGTTFIIEFTFELGQPWQMIGTTTKASYDTNHTNPAGTTFFRVKAQKGEIISDPGNIVSL